MLKPPTSEESYLREIDYVAPRAKLSHQNAPLYIFEDNEALMKMIIEKPEPHNETRVPNPQSGS